ncbi:SH3 domain-containing protein [Nostoc sp. TCL26-01]|uniref:SH3 domain-containing protein n=1 Tax=Nostoc sp. TCL26-01 TaxID=2576904 RepID=UPI0015C13CD9|nr:SH3 domain-containing protein [Nostoc sp. TCL26-01]QLE58073.1 SH3 domain-containing protein [Nostoc sp. TCL26-01]
MFSGLLKFILGFFLAIAILVGSGVAVALYFMNRTAIPPAKPIYANDSPALKDPNSPEDKTTPTSESQASASPSSTPSPTPTETPDALPKGAYKGRVTWSQGLSLRAEPTQDAERIGGVGFNEKIIVLEENSDKTWVKIRTEDSKQEGWIKIGNIQRVDE